MNLAALDEITEEALALDDGVDSFMRVDACWRRWESNPERSDTLTLRGHSVFPRIAIKVREPDFLLLYLAVPLNAPAFPGLSSLFGH